MSELTKKSCQPCRKGAAALKGEAIIGLLRQLADWEVVNEHHLSKEFRFPDFVTALAFLNKVGEIAEHEGHHPDLHLSWGRVAVEIWTHKVGGLTESDFVLAAKIDELPAS